MTRDDAIDMLVQRDLAGLSCEKRERLLLDWWAIDSNDANYGRLPDQLKKMIACSDEPEDPTNPVYDSLLEIALEHSYVGVINSFLKSQTTLMGRNESIEGAVEELEICPCCGYRSLQESRSCEICPVCFWEDDGTTEPDRYSEPNHMTLGDAQLSFRLIGAVAEKVRPFVLPDGRDRYASTIP